MPRVEIRRAVGLKPVSPQNAAGIRSEPPVSLPRPAAAMPCATEAAAPEEEPPATRGSSGCQGERGVPRQGLTPSPEKANSLMLVRPTSTAPARRISAIAGASAVAGGASSSTREPARVTWPATS